MIYKSFADCKRILVEVLKEFAKLPWVKRQSAIQQIFIYEQLVISFFLKKIKRILPVKYFMSTDSARWNCPTESDWEVWRPNFRSVFMVLPHYPDGSQVIDSCLTGSRKNPKEKLPWFHTEASEAHLKCGFFACRGLTAGPCWRWVDGVWGGWKK